MENQKKPIIELTTSLEDWRIVRECYVKSFFHYPLYKYMVPDPSKREDFLRAYLDANFEVTVGSGQGILLVTRLPIESENEQTEPQLKVIGGVVFVPPSTDGSGWSIENDEPYWNAYEKYGLAKISEEGLQRVKRYEAWENGNIAQKASSSRVPLWNGLFCAIAPEHASKGVGSAVYKEAIKIMARFWVKQQNSSQKMNVQEKQEEVAELQSKLFRSSLNQFHQFGLLHQKAVPAINFPEKTQEKPTQLKNVSIKDMMFNPKAPLVVAISHSERASRFHQSNGFQPVSRLPYYDEVDDVTPFYTHVLILDPFCTGRLQELKASLLSNNNNEICNLSQIKDNLKSIENCNILI